ncbi:MFS transporter [Mycobacterium avium]|uniref:MFS transporter n=1 Tax=Mycobacterium avium TaxID=1764 RepID=UPI000BAFA6AF|nr:MFS transporter [Mycobacterium avium]PBA69085.1 MFS transporter [Mycobacterium avium]
MFVRRRAGLGVSGFGHRWPSLAVLLAAAVVAPFATAIVNVAIPAIQTSINASDATLSWIVSGYALGFGLSLVPAGRVGDRVGHKWMFIAGLSLFTVASLWCGLCRSDTALIAARAAQGLAGGMFFAQITALIQLMFSGRQRVRALAMTGATIGLSTAAAPLVGGVVIAAAGTDLGWRLVFGLNVPIGVAAAIAAVRVLPTAGEQRRDIRADWLGIALLSAALIALLTPLIEGQQVGWQAWSYASITAAGVLLAAFAAWERRVEKASGSPLVPPRLFTHGSFTCGVALAMVYFAAFTSIFFVLALLWQLGLGRSALQSGLVVMPFAIGNIAGASRSDAVSAKLGVRVLPAALAMVSVGITGTWAVLAFVPATSYHGWQLLAPLALMGIGTGLFNAPNTSYIIATVDPGDAGAASGVIGVMQRGGTALGTALVGTVLFGTLGHASHGAGTAAAYGHSAALAMAVSAALSVAALALAGGLAVHARPPSTPPP